MVADPNARYFGARLSERALIPADDAWLGETRFEDWLRLPTREIRNAPPQPAVVAAAPSYPSSPSILRAAAAPSQ